MEESESQFHLNCTNFTTDQLKYINLTRSVTAMVCVLMVVLVLLFLIANKAYTSTLQRLYIYLLIGTLFSEAIQAVGLEHQWKYAIQEELCKWLAFVTHWTSVMVFLAALAMILYLVFIVHSQVRSNPFRRYTLSKCSIVTLELAYALLPVLVSLGFALEPHFTGNYGLAGPWCWIRSVDENCDDVGMRDQMIYFGLYELVGVIGVISTIVFALLYYRLATMFREARRLLRQTLLLMSFLLAYIAIVTLQLCVRLYTGLTGHREHYPLWFMHALVIPLGQLMFPLGCLVCFYSFKKLCHSCYSLCGSCPKQKAPRQGCKQNIPRVRTVQWKDQISQAATVQESHWVSQPSNTFFQVPYTDDFTHITNNVTAGEEAPLVTYLDGTDTGYNSITVTDVAN